jgi:hypothetical protein
MASASSSVPITSVQALYTAAGFSIPAIRLWVGLEFERIAGDPIHRNCLWDSGAPLSVVPYDAHHLLSFAWQPLPGPWPPGFTSWFGVPCMVGRMQVWARVPHAPFLVGPLTFVAKFVQLTPPQLSGTLPILLGLNFLADHQAEVTVQCHTTPNAGWIQLP